MTRKNQIAGKKVPNVEDFLFMTVAASDWCPFNRYRGSQGIDPLTWLSSSLLCTCNRMFQNLCPLWVQTTCDKITWQLNITEFKESFDCLQFVG